MLSIAIIALEFPPLNTAGSVRPFRMAEALAKKGFRISVFTISKDPRFKIFSKPNNLGLTSKAFNLLQIAPSHPEKIKRNKLREWFSVGDYFLDVWGEDVQQALNEHIMSHGKPD